MWASGGLQKAAGVWILPHTVWLAGTRGGSRAVAQIPGPTTVGTGACVAHGVILWRHHLGGVWKEQLEVLHKATNIATEHRLFISLLARLTIFTPVSLLYPIRQLFLETCSRKSQRCLRHLTML